MSAVSSGQPKLYDIGRELYHIAALDVPCDEAARHVILNMLLDVAPQRPRAKLRRVTATRHGLCQLRSNIYLHLPFPEPLVELSQQEDRDFGQRHFIQRLVNDHPVETIQELRFEYPLPLQLVEDLLARTGDAAPPLHLANEFGAGVAGRDDHSIGKTDGAAKHISKAAIIEHL